MDRKVDAIIVMLAVILALTAGFVMFGLNSSIFYPQKLQVSNMRLIWALAPGYSPQAIFNFTVRNSYNSYMTTVGLTIDGANYGLSTLQVPPGQTLDESLPLDLTLSGSKTYSITLTFIFADGKYETHSGSYTTAQFKGEATVASISLTTQGTYSSTFNLTILNTGNLPITSAKYMVEDYPSQGSLPIMGALMPEDTVTGGRQQPLIDYQAGTVYAVTIQLTYVDGSASSINTWVIAQQ